MTEAAAAAFAGGYGVSETAVFVIGPKAETGLDKKPRDGRLVIALCALGALASSALPCQSYRLFRFKNPDAPSASALISTVRFSTTTYSLPSESVESDTSLSGLLVAPCT